MRYVGKKTMVAAALLASTAMANAADVEVLHWWTSGGEAAALNVLKDDLQGQSIGWNDMPVAGGGGESAMTVLRARVTAGDPPTAVQMLGFDILDWAEGQADEGYSFGLLPDGTGTPQTLSPTKGAANETSTASDETDDSTDTEGTTDSGETGDTDESGKTDDTERFLPGTAYHMDLGFVQWTPAQSKQATKIKSKTTQ